MAHENEGSMRPHRPDGAGGAVLCPGEAGGPSGPAAGRANLAGLLPCPRGPAAGHRHPAQGGLHPGGDPFHDRGFFPKCLGRGLRPPEAAPGGHGRLRQAALYRHRPGQRAGGVRRPAGGNGGLPGPARRRPAPAGLPAELGIHSGDPVYGPGGDSGLAAVRLSAGPHLQRQRPVFGHCGHESPAGDPALRGAAPAHRPCAGQQGGQVALPALCVCALTAAHFLRFYEVLCGPLTALAPLCYTGPVQSAPLHPKPAAAV